MFLGMALALCAQAGTVSVTFLGADTGVSNGTDLVLPYQLSINGMTSDAVCYDILDGVALGQTWTANVWTVSQAAAIGQFSTAPNALTAYQEVAFLSQQPTSSAQNQIDLQEDIWNVFGGSPFPVSPGMQSYLDLLNTAAYASFNFNSVQFLEDVNQGAGRTQAFVVSSSSPGLNTASSTPEPGTLFLLSGGLLMLFGAAYRRHAANVVLARVNRS